MTSSHHTLGLGRPTGCISRISSTVANRFVEASTTITSGALRSVVGVKDVAVMVRDLITHMAARALTATELALRAGDAMVEAKMRSAREGGVRDVNHKGCHDLVTDTDRSNEAMIQQGLLKAFPEDGFLGEETSAKLGSVPTEVPEDRLTWICDPIDGTTNFVHGFPVTCVSIALARGNKVLLGVIYNPFTDELYEAVDGCGAYLNGSRIVASGTTSLDRAIVVSEYSSVREEETLRKMIDTTGSITTAARAVRQTGCGAMDLCFLARGSVDAIFGGVEGVWKPWDWAAGVLIAVEAGAVVSADDGSEFRLMGCSFIGAATLGLSKALLSQVAGPE